MKHIAMILFTSTLLCGANCYSQQNPPHTLAATAQDHQQIETLLNTYTRAVSTKNQSLFETLLLSKQIPFSYIGEGNAGADPASVADYEGFRESVFEGRPFTQTFKDIKIVQDGNLADVQLIFMNRTANASSWGWKTLQLLKVKGDWKIASEFYTSH